MPRRTLSILLLTLLTALVLLPAEAQKKPKRDHLGKARAALTVAQKHSKKPAIKAGITQALGMLGKSQYAPAHAKVATLKRDAALQGESRETVLKLVEAEDAIHDLMNRKKKPGK